LLHTHAVVSMMALVSSPDAVEHESPRVLGGRPKAPLQHGHWQRACAGVAWVRRAGTRVAIRLQ